MGDFHGIFEVQDVNDLAALVADFDLLAEPDVTLERIGSNHSARFGERCRVEVCSLQFAPLIIEEAVGAVA